MSYIQRGSHFFNHLLELPEIDESIIIDVHSLEGVLRY
jgi:hypothetical protein